MKSRVTNLRIYALAKVKKAREFIYDGSTVDGAKVENTLGEGSWVPILVSETVSFLMFDELTTRQILQNQFAERLGPLGLDTFNMLVVDFMHECELGTWKALFTHLLRLLYAIPGGSQLVFTLDGRYEEFTRNAAAC
jgi:hypothetical protein